MTRAEEINRGYSKTGVALDGRYCDKYLTPEGKIRKLIRQELKKCESLKAND